MPTHQPIADTLRVLPSRPNPGWPESISSELVKIVGAARAGDEDAWSKLVRRFDPMVRRVVGRYGLGHTQTDDVVQETWLRLFRHNVALREPRALGSWLATTARREAMRALQVGVKEVLSDDLDCDEAGETDDALADLLAGDRRGALTRAICRLPPRQRALMLVLLSDPPPAYQSASEITGIPTGSIGPIRGRALVRLARDPSVRALREDGRSP
jgi:RNA polymerase sigma factor (sigma-70 family)